MKWLAPNPLRINRFYMNGKEHAVIMPSFNPIVCL